MHRPNQAAISQLAIISVMLRPTPHGPHGHEHVHHNHYSGLLLHPGYTINNHFDVAHMISFSFFFLPENVFIAEWAGNLEILDV